MAIDALTTNAWLGTTLPARKYQATDWEWEHQVRIWLPPSYHKTEKTYPAVWVTDNFFETMMAAVQCAGWGFGPEIIIIAIGAPAETVPMEVQRRRSYDFLPDISLMDDFTRSHLSAEQVGGAPGFLDFLINQLRPELSEEFRIDPEKHGYAGHSGGGNFGYFALFNQPSSFSHYLISSPGLTEPWLNMEANWFSSNKDLCAKVFLSVGENENTYPGSGVAQLISSVTMIGERLDARQYPSLQLEMRIFPGEDHHSVVPRAYTTGIRYLYGE